MPKLRISFIGIILALLILAPFSGTSAQGGTLDKMTLWNSGTTQLRGANIFQRLVYPDLDGTDFLGDGYIGPPYTQSDFNQLAAMGANYVNLSVPGIYTITPPYVLDTQAEANLDNLLAMVQNANMFAVISFRTGPGRNDFTFYPDVVDPSDVIQTIWTDQTLDGNGHNAEQNAWVSMWHDTAARYKDNPVVAGYDLMVEPNSNAVIDPPIYDPQEFYNTYTDTTYDWNQLAPRLIDAVRQSDTDTPILLGSNGWSGFDWLNYNYISTDPRLVYDVHNYEPGVYAQQDYSAHMYSYPGVFDADYDGVDDTVNKAWQENWYENTLDVFRANEPSLPISVNEIGVTRWSPGASTYLSDEFSVIESRGLNHAIWMYHANWQPFKDGDNSFDFMLGSDPNNTHNVSTSPLIQVIKQDWAKNTIRPFFVSPANAAPARNYFTTAPVTLTWARVSGATGYWIQVADSAAFTNLIFDNQNQPLSPDTLSYAPALDDGTYYWRVRAREPDGVTWGAWSTAESFQLNAP